MTTLSDRMVTAPEAASPPLAYYLTNHRNTFLYLGHQHSGEF